MNEAADCIKTNVLTTNFTDEYFFVRSRHCVAVGLSAAIFCLSRGILQWQNATAPQKYFRSIPSAIASEARTAAAIKKTSTSR
jgi:hypothetical protein